MRTREGSILSWKKWWEKFSREIPKKRCFFLSPIHFCERWTRTFLSHKQKLTRAETNKNTFFSHSVTYIHFFLNNEQGPSFHASKNLRLQKQKKKKIFSTQWPIHFCQKEQTTKTLFSSKQEFTLTEENKNTDFLSTETPIHFCQQITRTFLSRKQKFTLAEANENTVFLSPQSPIHFGQQWRRAFLSTYQKFTPAETNKYMFFFSPQLPLYYCQQISRTFLSWKQKYTLADANFPRQQNP